MRSAVVADDARAVHGEYDGEILDGDIVQHLVEPALQERRVDRDNRHDALRRQTGGHRHRVLLADADVDDALRELAEERQQSGAARHRRRDRDRSLVALQDLAHRVGEDGGVLRRRGLRRPARGHAVPFHVVVLGRTVAVALLRVHVHEHRAVAKIARLREDAFDREQVVAVDGTEVGEAELLEQEVRDKQRLEAVEDAASRLLGQLPRGHVLEHLSHDVLRAAVRGRGAHRLEHPRDRADVRRDAHAVVVEDDDHSRPARADVVQGLPGHARGQGTVADDRHHVLVPALEVACDGHPLGR